MEPFFKAVSVHPHLKFLNLKQSTLYYSSSLDDLKNMHCMILKYCKNLIYLYLQDKMDNKDKIKREYKEKMGREFE